MPVSTTRPNVLLFALLFLATTFQQVAAKYCTCECNGSVVQQGDSEDCYRFCQPAPCASKIVAYESTSRLAYILPGVGALLIIAGMIGWCCYRRRRQQKQHVVYQTAN
ncbi:hypothetical protein BJ741DRAFT_596571 [Chytriomyces cf. hyalinus JEL632]|nr:hypothetical protein BJ741DRAFT_596571 [Chytriomyces cf. hyalinus JEL632]